MQHILWIKIKRSAQEEQEGKIQVPDNQISRNRPWHGEMKKEIVVDSENL